MENSEIKKAIIMDYFRAKNKKYTGMMVAAARSNSTSMSDTTMKILKEIMNEMSICTPMNTITSPIYAAAMMLSSKGITSAFDAEQQILYDLIIKSIDYVAHTEVPVDKYVKSTEGENGGT